MPNPDAKRFLIRLSAFVPFVCALLFFNWIGGEPSIRRHFTSALDDAAEALIAGHTIRSLVDMRDLKPVWIEHLRIQPDVLILGSSRVVQIPQQWFGPHPMLNAALLGGDFSDSVALLQKCLETGKTPKLVLLELNPTLTFADRARVEPALAPPFRRAMFHYGIFPPIFFSGPLTLDALRWDPHILLDRSVWQLSEELVPGAFRMRPDGSADWGVSDRRLSAGEVEQIAIADMLHLDTDRQHWRATSDPGFFDRRILRALAGDLHARGIRLVTVLVPVHPVAFDYYRKRGGYDDTWIRRDMAASGVPVIGAFSPAAVKAGREDFYDDVHARPEVLHRMLRQAGIVE